MMNGGTSSKLSEETGLIRELTVFVGPCVSGLSLAVHKFEIVIFVVSLSCLPKGYDRTKTIGTVAKFEPDVFRNAVVPRSFLECFTVMALLIVHRHIVDILNRERGKKSKLGWPP